LPPALACGSGCATEMKSRALNLRGIEAALMALAITVLSACHKQDSDAGGTGGGTGGLSGIVPNECEQTAGLYCEEVFRCNPEGEKWEYGSIERCKQEDATRCHAIARQPGADTKAVIKAWADCNRAWGAQSCDESLFGPELAACRASKGTRKNGEACESAFQCASAYCKFPVDPRTNTLSDRTCGACATAPGLGAECQEYGNGCDLGLVCWANTCLKAGKEGDACDLETTGCQGSLLCIEGSCSKPRSEGGKCEDSVFCLDDLVCLGGSCSKRLAGGEACKADDFACVRDLGCVGGKCGPRLMGGAPCTGLDDCETRCVGLSQPDGTITDGRCMDPTPSATSALDGEPCRPLPMGADAGTGDIDCSYDTYCDATTMKCTRTKLVDQPCASKGECLDPLDCTAGKCAYPVGSMCQ
jgi:hypothetical protein